MCVVPHSGKSWDVQPMVYLHLKLEFEVDLQSLICGQTIDGAQTSFPCHS